MTLKELFKKHNAQPGFKFKNEISLNPYEVLYIGNFNVFVRQLNGGEEMSFYLHTAGCEKYEEPKKTEKIMVADYWDVEAHRVITSFSQLDAYPLDYKKVIGPEREILVEDD